MSTKTPTRQQELERIKNEALEIQSVLNERGEVDVSKVTEGVETVDFSGSSLADVSVAFSGKASEDQMTAMNERDPELVARAQEFQNAGQFASTEEVPEQPKSEVDKLLDEKNALDTEIRTLEDKMASREQNRSDAYDEAGIFDDMRVLNQLKDKKRTLEDREIEIPIEGRQRLRGRTATKADFNQLTMEATEKNLLNQLAASRQVSRMTDTIETNLAIVDSQLNGQNAKEDFIYEKKVERLNGLTSAYADIMSEAQKEALEYQKFQYGLIRDSNQADIDLRNDLITELVKTGKYSGYSVNEMMNMSADDLIGLSYDTTSPYNWTNLTPDEAAVLLDDDEFDRYETLQEWKKTATEEEQAVVDQKVALQQTANDTIDLIENMLDDKAGLSTSVGEAWAGRQDFRDPLLTGFGTESKKFRANFKKLVSQKTLDKLLELKAAGGTLGAISEKELDMLQKAATALGSIEDKNGKASGKSNLSEADFKTAMETLRMASMKVYIAESIGKKAYDEAGFVNLSAESAEDFETIEKMYKDLKANPPGAQNFSDEELRSEENLDTAFNKIREEEGLVLDAYQDSTGTWTIGFGNTQINGRAVQQGDRLTERQAENLMRTQVVEKYTTFADTVESNLTPNQFAALTSFEYNLGSGVWQTDTGRRILQLINNGNNQEAGQLMLQYHKSRDPQTGDLVYNNVLAQRRLREANLLLS